MKTILVATDFSTAAANAAHYAAEMALAINADLFLLHVFQIPINYLEVPAALNEAQMTLDPERSLAQLKEELTTKTKNKIPIESEIRTGIFFTELNAVCERINPYAVVMGSQGTTAATRLLLGGHTIYALKNLMWPLITVSPQATFSSIKNIGLACDFNKVTDTVPADEIKKLVEDFHAKLHVLNTGRQRTYNPEIVFESGTLRDLLKDIQADYHFIPGDDKDQAIIDFAEKNHIDFLIVLPKRHGLFDKLVHKSHSKQLVLHSHVPVMALHK
ncbi:universal stress protein [Panacibacter ginsenosidivorans]|uniref:Universal stress protein n=1 Tax=Panacibacter ginsenosidivorans TaxID=1813871 RepID=A0A5B8V3L0_9BACT|nr:universal stress protein [Panacibacter ginsenosidivorans]QEC65792.1 universal stress protein [Panacibacter ginsenosidivorans]